MVTNTFTPGTAPRPASTAVPGFWWRLAMPLVAVVAGFITLIVVSVVLLINASDATAGAVATAAASAVLLGCGLAMIRHLPRHERRQIFASKAGRATTLATGIGVGVALAIGSGLIISLGTWLDPGLGSRVHGIEAPLGPGVAGTLLTMLAVMVFAPIGEELIFRGILLRGLVRRIPFWWAAVISAAIFGACHADVWIYLLWPRYLALAGIGVVLAAFNRSRGYWCGVTAHATINTVATLALLLAR
jgi:membrane protease YdiL (CAAX protease family)